MTPQVTVDTEPFDWWWLAGWAFVGVSLGAAVWAGVFLFESRRGSRSPRDVADARRGAPTQPRRASASSPRSVPR